MQQSFSGRVNLILKDNPATSREDYLAQGLQVDKYATPNCKAHM
jgi:hypothetical protein